MEVRATTADPIDTGADTIVVGIFDGKGVPHDLEGEPLGALLASGEARSSFRHLALARESGRRWLLVGLGARDEFDAERARVVAATVAERARELGTGQLCWELPHKVGDDVAGALVEGTLLAGYRFDRYKRSRRDDPDDEKPAGPRSLVVSAHHDIAAGVARGELLATAVNRARDLQNTPANDLTPTALADHARSIAELAVEVEGLAEIERRGMGAFAAVARGSRQQPALITLRYEPAEPPPADTPLLAIVGKAVTFDTGGISIKPARNMGDMKFDMSGGAAAIEALRAIALLGLPIRAIAVVGAVENMPGGGAMRPGDVLPTMQGTTIEVSTDAEGRLVLADCLAHAVELGAERIVDVATLTGAIVSALGSTYAGLMSNDDRWAAAVEAAGTRSGELVWRLPLHREYDELIKGRTGDVVNQAQKAGAIAGAALLRRFVGDVPWAHLDVAGTSWDLGRAYASKGGSGFGVRLLVALAESLCAPDGDGTTA